MKPAARRSRPPGDRRRRPTRTPARAQAPARATLEQRRAAGAVISEVSGALSSTRAARAPPQAVQRRGPEHPHRRARATRTRVGQPPRRRGPRPRGGRRRAPRAPGGANGRQVVRAAARDLALQELLDGVPGARAGPPGRPARRPGRSPGRGSPRRPARPASWTIRAKARSSERKPANWRGASASTTAGDGDVGQVVPLGHHLGAEQDRRRRAAANSASRRATAPRPEALEPSMRTSRAEGTSRASAASTPCEPDPLTRDVGARDSAGRPPAPAPRGRSGGRPAAAAPRAGPGPRRSPGSGRSIRTRGRAPSARSRAGWPARSPSRPRRAASCSAAASGRDTGPAPCVRMSTISTAGSGEPSARSGRRQARQGVPGLGARRRAAVDDRRPGRPRPAGGHLAGVVARRGVLLVGAVVLLVDHDQAEVRPPGAKTALRAPSTTSARALAHAPVLGRPLGRA